MVQSWVNYIIILKNGAVFLSLSLRRCSDDCNDLAQEAASWSNLSDRHREWVAFIAFPRQQFRAWNVLNGLMPCVIQCMQHHGQHYGQHYATGSTCSVWVCCNQHFEPTCWFRSSTSVTQKENWPWPSVCDISTQESQVKDSKGLRRLRWKLQVPVHFASTRVTRLYSILVVWSIPIWHALITFQRLRSVSTNDLFQHCSPDVYARWEHVA